MAVKKCEDQCFIEVDSGQIAKLYDLMSAKIKKDLQEEYDCKRISGATYAESFTQLMNGVITQAFGAVVALQNKETAMDRCVKKSQCELNASKVKLDEANIKVAEANIKNIEETIKATEANILLTDAKKKAEDIKNGDLAAADSIYDKNKNVLTEQGKLLDRQRIGYDDNKLQKLFDSQIKAWSVVFQDTDMTCVTPVIMNDAMVGVFNELAPSNIDINKPYYPAGSECSESGTGEPED